MLKKQVCYHKRNVPNYCHCKYIEGGYRNIDLNWLECVKGVFHANNETLNFWTHFVPLLLMVKRFYTYVSKTEDSTHFINYPFYIHTFSVCYVLTASCIAHMFCACSKFTHKVCFTWDHVCIVLYGVALQVGLEIYACPVEFFGVTEGMQREPYLKFSFIYCTLQIMLICISNGPSPMAKWKFLIRDIPFFIGFVIGNFPCFQRYFSTEQYSMPCFAMDDTHRSLYFQGFLWILAGIIIYSTKFPEILKPGYFDIVGHSHQLFHICVAIGMYLQNYYIEVALQKRKIEINVGASTGLNLTADDIFDCIVHFLTIFVLGHVICLSYHLVFVQNKEKKP